MGRLGKLLLMPFDCVLIGFSEAAATKARQHEHRRCCCLSAAILCPGRAAGACGRRCCKVATAAARQRAWRRQHTGLPAKVGDARRYVQQLRCVALLPLATVSLPVCVCCVAYTQAQHLHAEERIQLCSCLARRWWWWWLVAGPLISRGWMDVSVECVGRGRRLCLCSAVVALCGLTKIRMRHAAIVQLRLPGNAVHCIQTMSCWRR